MTHFFTRKPSKISSVPCQSTETLANSMTQPTMQMQVNIRMDWIIKEVMTKSGDLRIDNGGDIEMSSDATWHQTSYSKLINCHHNMFASEHISTVFVSLS